MTKLKIQSARKNEKGIALVFSLIVLSLLLILSLSFALDSMFSQKIDVKVTGINITKVILHGPTETYDYTKALTKDLSATPFLVYSGDSVTTTPAEVSAWFGFAVHDPRQNLHAADWIYLTPTVADSATADPKTVFSLTGASPWNGAPNAENSTTGGGGDNTEAPNIEQTSPTGMVDLETDVTDPANGKLSTAFIRNAPMKSPWELGFIHRGVRWQTINLKIYDTSKAFKVVDIGGKNYIPGGGLYSAGDANILDQIKMTEKPESPQKINLKSQRIEIFKALFKKINLAWRHCQRWYIACRCS